MISVGIKGPKSLNSYFLTTRGFSYPRLSVGTTPSLSRKKRRSSRASSEGSAHSKRAKQSKPAEKSSSTSSEPKLKRRGRKLTPAHQRKMFKAAIKKLEGMSSRTIMQDRALKAARTGLKNLKGGD